MQVFAQFAERFWRSNDHQGFEITREGADTQLIGGVGGVAIFIELVEIGFVHRRATITPSLGTESGRIGFNFMVFPVFTLMVGLGDQLDVIAFTLIAKKQHLAAIDHKNKRIFRYRHENQTREAASGSFRELERGHG